MREIVTSYYKPPIDLSAVGSKVPTPNYTLYTLFALKTKIAPRLKSYLEGATMSYGSKEINGSIYITVIVKVDGEPITLDDEMYVDISQMVAEAIRLDRDMCLLFESSSSFIFDDICFNPEWVSSIIKSTVGSGGQSSLYVKLDQYDNYEQEYSRLYLVLLKNLAKLYRLGSIKLDSRLDANFIKRWELVPSDTHTNIYHPSWRNVFVTKSPTPFLEDMYDGITHVEFMLKPSINERHHISKILDVTYTSNSILVPCSSYKECVTNYNMIVESMIMSRGIISTSITPSNYKDYVDYVDDKFGVVRSYKTSS